MKIEDLWMSLRSGFFMIFFIIDPAGGDLKSSIFNRQSSINGVCDFLKP